MKMRFDKILRLIPRKYRTWLILLLLLVLGLSKYLGFDVDRYLDLAPTSKTASSVVTGYPRVIDGDSFRIDRDEVRLVGIDAPEGPQTCERDGRPWSCGEASRKALIDMIASRDVTCDYEKRDKHDRALAVCRVGNLVLNREMVARGFAVSFGRYRQEERAAKAAKRGIWISKFQQPKAWRAEQRNNR